jgi:hypothetical protein
MRFALQFAASIVVGFLSAGIGWFTAGAIGTFYLDHIARADDLGATLLAASLLYSLALLFGIVGSALCMALLLKRRASNP